MRQVLQYRRSGATRVVEVPAPTTPHRGILVHNQWSLISPGTERMLVEAGGANLIHTALHRKDLVKQVVDKAARDGIAATVNAVRTKLDSAIPLGYSCAGTVLVVGPHASDLFSVGQRVACAGAGLANHAEVVAVPRNLSVRVPDAVSLEDAAFVTIGAVALQGVRIADVRLGEACVVIDFDDGAGTPRSLRESYQRPYARLKEARRFSRWTSNHPLPQARASRRPAAAPPALGHPSPDGSSR